MFIVDIVNGIQVYSKVCSSCRQDTDYYQEDDFKYLSDCCNAECFTRGKIMQHTVMTMIENIHSQIQEVLNDNINKLDVQNALYQLEEVRDILDVMGEE